MVSASDFGSQGPGLNSANGGIQLLILRSFIALSLLFIMKTRLYILTPLNPTFI